MDTQTLLVAGGLAVGLLTLWHHVRKHNFDRLQATRRLEVHVYYGRDCHGEHELVMARIRNPSGVKASIENIAIGRPGLWPWNAPLVFKETEEYFQIYSPRAEFQGVTLDGGESERFCVNLETVRRVIAPPTTRDGRRFLILAAEAGGRCFVGRGKLPKQV